MEENKSDLTAPATGEATPAFVSEITEDDLEQVSGGTKKTIPTPVRDAANQIQLDKTKTAEKNFQAMSDLIKG